MTDLSASATPTRLAVRAVPVVAPRGATRLPLALVLAYVISTFILFLIWPINWPIYYASHWARLIFYVALCFAVLGGAAFFGSAGASRVTAPLPYATALLVAGAIAATLLLVPSCFAYTGRGPWEVLDALRDQGAAYRRMQIQLFTTSGQRDALVAARALAAPLTYAVLPLGIVRWRTIGLAGRLAIGVAIAASMTFSIMRGTDKEIADLFVIGLAAAFVAFGRTRLLDQRGMAVLRASWKPLLVGFVFLYVAQGLFTMRKDERLGGYASRTAICANDSRICANLDNPWISWLPLRQRFGLTVFIMTTCSGYYGLELALEKPFVSSWGVGHSPAALSVYETLTDDPTPHLNTYTWRNGRDHWSDEHYWSTLITWIANDVGFAGALVVLGLIGFLWGKWWREAAAGMSDPAAVLFALATLTIFYLPANNQLLASYDGYTALGGWVVIWLWHRRRAALSAALPIAAADDRP